MGAKGYSIGLFFRKTSMVIMMSEDIIIKMKEKMLDDQVIMKEVEKLMTDGLSQDEALDVLIYAWASSK